MNLQAFFSENLSGERGRWVALGAISVLVIFLCYSLVTSVIEFLPKKQVDMPRDSAGQPTTQPVQNGATRPQVSLTELHIFGEYLAEPAPGSVDDAPTTTLQLKLVGVFSASEDENATAVIEASGRAQAYSVGASVPGGANVHSIMPDRVILDINGRLEALPLEKEGLEQGQLPDGQLSNQKPSFSRIEE